MGKIAQRILAVNAGSSSVEFALFDANNLSKKMISGNIDDAVSAATQIIKQIGEYIDSTGLAAIGHRVVHG